MDLKAHLYNLWGDICVMCSYEYWAQEFILQTAPSSDILRVNTWEQLYRSPLFHERKIVLDDIMTPSHVPHWITVARFWVSKNREILDALQISDILRNIHERNINTVERAIVVLEENTPV